MVTKEVLLEMFSEFLEKASGSTKQVVEPTAEVVKSLNEEKRLATFVVLAPDEVDLHGDIYTQEEVEKACYDYNKNCMKANLKHLLMVDDDTAYIAESYILPCDLMLDDKMIKKGTWIQTWKITSEMIWKGVKDGYYTGLSIQCMADTEELEDES